MGKTSAWIGLWAGAALLTSATVAVGQNAPVPKFEVDPFWPKPLPNNWTLGQVGGIAVDDGHGQHGLAEAKQCGDRSDPSPTLDLLAAATGHKLRSGRVEQEQTDAVMASYGRTRRRT